MDFHITNIQSIFPKNFRIPITHRIKNLPFGVSPIYPLISTKQVKRYKDATFKGIKKIVVFFTEENPEGSLHRRNPPKLPQFTLKAKRRMLQRLGEILADRSIR